MHYTDFHAKWQQLMADEAGQQAALLLKQVVVSRGGFTLDMAAALAESDDITAQLDKLMALNLVIYAPETGRYDVEPDARPMITPDEAAAGRHLVYCISYLKSSPAAPATEVDNIDQALEYAFDTGKTEQATWLVEAASEIGKTHWQRVVRWHERLLKLSTTSEGHWAALYYHLGQLYIMAFSPALRGYLPLAIIMFQQALNSQESLTPDMEALICLDLATAYYQQADFEDTPMRALAQSRAALERLWSILPDDRSALAAGAYVLDGRVAMQLSQYNNRYANLVRSIDALRSAEAVWRALDDSLQLLRTQLLIGDVYFLMAMVSNPVDNFKQVLDVCRKAFDELTTISAKSTENQVVLTELETPFHNLMGKAHYELANFVDKQRHLRLALDEFDQVIQRARLPESHWHFATVHIDTLFHSANAWSRLAALDKNTNLAYRALALYEEVLEFWTPEAKPADYARVQYHMGDAYITLRDNAAAYRSYSLAQHAFVRAGDYDNAWVARMGRHYYRIVHAAPVMMLRFVTIPVARAYIFLATRLYRAYRWLAG